MIKDRFLPDEDIPLDLPTVCAAVEARESRKALDAFIYELFIDFTPSESVFRVIPRYTWRRAYTTNFDRLLEAGYDRPIRHYGRYTQTVTVRTLPLERTSDPVTATSRILQTAGQENIVFQGCPAFSVIHLLT